MNKIPEIGIYVASKQDYERYVVTDVFISKEEESKGFFLVTFIPEADVEDMSAPDYSLDPEQWFSFVEEIGLQKID
jgi:hypothetical protein